MESDFRLKDYLICVSHMPVLAPMELEKACQNWRLGDERARRLLEERHLHQVVGWVQPYRGAGLSFMALIETGNRGLIKALRRMGQVDAEALADHLRLAVEEEVEAVLLAHRAA